MRCQGDVTCLRWLVLQLHMPSRNTDILMILNYPSNIMPAYQPKKARFVFKHFSLSMTRRMTVRWQVLRQLDRLSTNQYFPFLRNRIKVTPNLGRCPTEKQNRVRAVFKKTPTNYTPIERSWSVQFIKIMCSLVKGDRSREHHTTDIPSN